MKLSYSLLLTDQSNGLGTFILNACCFLVADHDSISGRGVGGSSAINFMVFQKPPAFDMNAWEKLGSPGWDWAHHDAAVKKSETYVHNCVLLCPLLFKQYYCTASILLRRMILRNSAWNTIWPLLERMVNIWRLPTSVREGSPNLMCGQVLFKLATAKS